MRTARALLQRASGALLGVVLAGCAAARSTAPMPLPGVEASATAVSLFVAAEDRVSTEVRITRTGGFADPVTLDVAGLPAHAIAEITPNPVRGDLASIEIVADRDVLPGLYALDVKVSSAGIESQSVMLDLHVTSVRDR
jgi:hypothetical protein